MALDSGKFRSAHHGLSEDAILACISSWFENTHPRLLLGRGDDCAVLRAGGSLCVSADMFLEDVHFRRSYFEPAEIGHKALAVNISDLAGFGAKPVAFSLCLGLPDWIDMSWLNAFFNGMSSLAQKTGVVLAGGDLSLSPFLAISITVFGEHLEQSGFLARGGSLPGDVIFVVGELGLARAGLAELEKEGRWAMKKWPEACRQHLKPEPQMGAGLMLARAGYIARPPALMDLSDGLMRDLPRLLGHDIEQERKLGASLNIQPDMLHPEVRKHAEEQGTDPIADALQGGEDYALLGACAPDMAGSLQTAIAGFKAIGVVTTDGRITCNGEDVSYLKGFDHFEA